MDEEEGWVTLNSDADIDNLDFSVFEYFVESTDNDFEERTHLEELYTAVKDEKKKAKEAEKKAKSKKYKTETIVEDTKTTEID